MTSLPAPGLRSALAEPTVNPPWRWVVALSLVNLAVMTGWFGPIQVLLAEQARELSPEHKEQVLGWVLGVGAFVSTVCNPLFGAFSDRTTLRMGRRLPWVLVGAAGGSLSLLVLSSAGSVPVMMLGWCGVQAFLNAMYAAVTASVPDQVPEARRGLVGGLLAIAQTLGVVGGVGIAAVTGSIAAGYLVTIVVLVVLTLPYALFSRDLALPEDYRPEPFQLGRFVRSFWISPRRYPDFAWAWITRFLVNTGNYIGTMYLLYYVTDGLGFSEDVGPDKVFVLTVVYAVSMVVTTAFGGAWSDRTGRRKIFVIWSGVVAGTATLILAIPQTYPAAVVAAAVLGCGYGIYTAVDFALITQVLPGAEERAKDLGVINIANALPQVFAPILAGVILGLVRSSGGTVATQGEEWSMGYGAVYGFAFLVSILGSMFVTRIRSVR
ncbi:MAG TPA: MFS transporter [Nocardioides sp.]|uniref:MFS transporter n=1 Tax=Nocardioides sp. TaxID=35761 RepID=UPI002BF38110|nr:MFS transporter [Nocardioides sp.]HQR28350.1 MFS transporter [Nocardioides sp.]